MPFLTAPSTLQKFVIRMLLAGGALLILLVWQVSLPAAQTLSDGCIYLNLSPFDTSNFGFDIRGVDLNAGERIVLVAGEPTSGSPSTFEFVFDGNSQTTSFPGSLSFTVLTDGTYNMYYSASPTASVTWSLSCGIPTAEPAPQIPEPICPIFTDNRINDCDAASPFAAYVVDGGLHLYAIDDDSNGTLTLQVPSDAIDAVPECPDENTLIAEDTTTGIQVYRLSSCEFQLMSPTADGQKTYVLIVDYLNTTEYLSREE